jgi:hypothetical protein
MSPRHIIMVLIHLNGLDDYQKAEHSGSAV